MPELRKEAAIDLTHELCDALRATTFLTGDGAGVRVTGSFGLATYPEDGETVQGILRSADTMMYDVKNSTRDDVAVMGQLRPMTNVKPIRAERRTLARG